MYLLLYYDEYHTPWNAIRRALPGSEKVALLVIRIGSESPSAGFAPSDPVQVIFLDARDRFADCYIQRAIKANACYENGYYLSAALCRPLIAEICAEQACRIHADTVVHGLAGNDYLRFAAGMRTLAPHLQLMGVTELCGSRTTANGDGYTRSSNLWGDSIEAGPLCNPAEPAMPAIWSSVVCANNSERHKIHFRHGIPTSLDGIEMALSQLIAKLNAIGRCFGVGRIDMVENGYVGLKTRAIYDAPAAMALVDSHHDLEHLVCSRREFRFKRQADAEWTELVYDGLWFDPARTSLEGYIDSINQRVTGSVELEFHSGGFHVIGRESPFAIYDERRAIYRAGHDFGALLLDELAEQHSLAARIQQASRIGSGER